MPHDLNSVRVHFRDARQELGGSIVFECPICRAEGHHAKHARLYANGAISCTRLAAGGSDANRAHCAPIREALGLADDLRKPFITKVLFDGTLIVECSQAARGKVQIVARNCNSVLNRDVVSLNVAKDRIAFIKALDGFDDSQREVINQALLQLADEYDRVCAAIEDDDIGDKPTVKIISKMLDDGRILEQIAGGTFAVYDPQRGEVTYSRKIETDEAVYRPLDDDFILKGGLFLPDRLVEYGDDATLDAEIDACIKRYSDVPERERGLSARYARLTYIADNLNEISYLRATGERGSGKSRYISTIGMLCLRPVLVTSPSAASLFRMMDAYAPTLTIDECNMASDSEDTQTLVQILNSGFQRVASVPRVEKGADGQQTIRMFSPFGPKLIGGLKLSESEAFESRCVAVKLQKTARKDIPFRMTARMLDDFADLRAKLYLWRLRNLGRDIEAALDQAEAELKNYRIEPRYIQIAIPIYGMIADEGLKKDFAAMMEGRTGDAEEDKKESFDGQIVALIHSRLFDVDDDGQARWKIKGDLPELEEGKPCEGLRIDFLVDCLNEGVPEKKQIRKETFSRYRLKPLGFKTRPLTKGGYRNSKSVVYCVGTFAEVFKNFSLPIPGDFADAADAAAVNGEGQEFALRRQGSETEAEKSCRRTGNPLEAIDLGGVASAASADFPETGEDSFSAASDDLADAFPIVALDTETEPFDEKRGIGPRNARMIGMSLSWDGAEKTDYLTDREA
ncbi:MAG: hypothetical protein ACREA2_20890 [Blastocatellia bacterium]